MIGARRRPSGRSPAGRSKPLDVGNGLLSASFGSDGRWLSLGAPAPRGEYVELTSLPDFQAEWRHDPAAVRRYRRWMADDRHWFLRLQVEGDRERAPGPQAVVDGSPRWSSARGRVRSEACAWACEDAARIVQLHRLRWVGRPPGPVEVRFAGALRAHPLPEITEADPPPVVRAHPALTASGARLTVGDRALDLRVEIGVSASGAAVGAWELDRERARLRIEPEARGAEELELLIECGLGRGASQGARRAPSPRHHSPALRVNPSALAPLATAGPGAPGVPARLSGIAAGLPAQNRAYISGCTALRVAGDEVCIVTDHRVLPLSWTRDAYYQALLLLTLDTADGRGRRLVASHLRWLWERCERPRGLWMRSHRPDGRPKDLRYQADQQLYPLLELADHHRVVGELPGPPRATGARGSATAWWRAKVGELWARLPVAEIGLVPTEETAADDSAALPFALSSQILYWYAARRVTELGLEADLTPPPSEVIRGVETAVRSCFAVQGPFGRQWAYEADCRGETRLYHDANDLPTALAPALGFCSTGDELWANTMRFAFSEHNAGYSAGEWGGLGSRHTPGTWTLGDIQEWLVAGWLGETHRSERALERLLSVAGADGLLPEAYDSATGGDPIRIWFAWPGAVLGTLLATSGALDSPRSGAP